MNLSFFALWVGVLLIGAAQSTFCAEAPMRMRIAYASRSSLAMPLYLAQTKGIFKEVVAAAARHRRALL